MQNAFGSGRQYPNPLTKHNNRGITRNYVPPDVCIQYQGSSNLRETASNHLGSILAKSKK